MATPKKTTKSPLSQMTLSPETYIDISNLSDAILHRISTHLVETSNHIPSTIAPLCLVNKRWNTLFTPTLYNTFTYTGEVTAVRKLWRFLRTIHRRPDLASLVYTLTLTTTHLVEPILAQALRPEWQRFFSMLRALARENHRWIIDALAQAGIADMHPDLLLAWNPPLFGHKTLLDIVPWTKYTHLLTALVIALCPNVNSLDVHVHPEDRFIHCIVNRAVTLRIMLQMQMQGIDINIDEGAELDIADDTDDDDDEKDDNVPTTCTPDSRSTINELPLQNLQTLTLGPAFSPALKSPGIFVLGDQYPFHLLPKLKKLTVQSPGANIQLTPGYLDGNVRIPIETLTLSNLRVKNLLWGLTRLAGLPSENLTSNLRHITMTLPHIAPQNLNSRIYSPIWAVLHHLRHQLESLDIQQTVDDRRVNLGLDCWYHNRNMCISLAEFPKLTKLNISLWILVALKCQHWHPYRLVSHPPPNVKELGLYAHPRLNDVMWEESMMRFNLHYELENTVLWASSTKRQVKAVFLEEDGPVEIMDAMARMVGVGEAFE
ncbi:hypothetical protein BDW74DRAFT_184061 [Aspergillus multicolor]|uniref:uncharacterized protein n=1 Tax=Aspergillus multicolor TaxID=41759 RepID=UPI003CCCC2EC